MLINIAVVMLLLRLLTANGVPTSLAFMATLPIVAAGPIATAQLLSALGASTEPLLYVIVLWMLRYRPVVFGVVLGIGAIHREFTVFALPAIALLQWLNLRQVRWPAILRSASAFAVTWIVIDQLKRHANLMGPASSDNLDAGGSLALEAVHVGRLLSFDPPLYIGRLRLLLTQGLPDLFGARSLPLFTGGIWGDGTVGSWVAGVALAAALVLCMVRLLWITVQRPPRGVQFQVFLALVALQALFAYGLHGGTEIEFRTELNYVLLALLLPVAILGAYFQLEQKRGYRRAAVLLLSVWTLSMLMDTASLVREYVMSPPPSPHRALADYLTSHGIRYAWAGYWDSYRVTFLSRERAIVASDDIVRIRGYQSRVELNRANAARIVRMPCGGGTRVAEWCVIDPFQR
jgi:hypothetical protein